MASRAKRAKKAARARLARLWLAGALGVLVSLVACFTLFALSGSLIYQIVVVFLTIIFLSNFLAKMFVSYLHYKTEP